MGKISVDYVDEQGITKTEEIVIPENKNYKLCWPEVRGPRRVQHRVYSMLNTEYWEKHKQEFEA